MAFNSGTGVGALVADVGSFSFRMVTAYPVMKLALNKLQRVSQGMTFHVAINQAS